MSSLMFMTFFFFMMSGGSPPMGVDEIEQRREHLWLCIDPFNRHVGELMY